MPVAADKRDNDGANKPDNCGDVSNEAYYHGFRYVRKIFQMLPEKPQPILLAQIFAKLTYARRYSSHFYRH